MGRVNRRTALGAVPLVGLLTRYWGNQREGTLTTGD
jgi:hypothetical protein